MLENTYVRGIVKATSSHHLLARGGWMMMPRMLRNGNATQLAQGKQHVHELQPTFQTRKQLNQHLKQHLGKKSTVACRTSMSARRPPGRFKGGVWGQPTPDKNSKKDCWPKLSRWFNEDTQFERKPCEKSTGSNQQPWIPVTVAHMPYLPVPVAFSRRENKTFHVTHFPGYMQAADSN